MEFKQFDINFDRFHYIIEEDGIRLIKKRIASSTNTFVDFEDIGSKIIQEKTRKIIWLIISIIFLIIGIAVFYKRMTGGKVGNGAEIFHLSVSLAFFLIFILTKKNTLYLTQSDNTNAIEFIGSNRYKEKVDIFIKNLLQTRDNYLIKKYSKIDEFLPYDQQYNNLVWLYKLRLLTKSQLQSKIEELNELDSKAESGIKNNLTKIVGFRNRSFEDEMENYGYEED